MALRHLALGCAMVAALVTPAAIVEVIAPDVAAATISVADTPCGQAMRWIWPRDRWVWADRMIWRESRGNPRAQNRRSSAAGCAQLTRRHAHRFEAVGYSWADRYDPGANMAAAWQLYVEQGARPWA